MRTHVLTTAALALIALAACHPARRADTGRVLGRPLKALAKLDCPHTQGRLKRVSIAADGRSCAYASDTSDVATISLLALNGKTPEAALQPIEQDLQALVPGRKFDVPAPPEPGGADHTKIDLPGFHVEADGSGRAHVKLPGIDVNADNDRAKVRTGWGGYANASVEADDGGALIRAGQVGRVNADLLWLDVSDQPGPAGWKGVGYVARGPVAGPLVVGQWKSKTAEHHGSHEDRGFKDLKRIVDRNVGDSGRHDGGFIFSLS